MTEGKTLSHNTTQYTHAHTLGTQHSYTQHTAKQGVVVLSSLRIRDSNMLLDIPAKLTEALNFCRVNLTKNFKMNHLAGYCAGESPVCG